jgi:hypothetical protein
MLVVVPMIVPMGVLVAMPVIVAVIMRVAMIVAAASVSVVVPVIVMRVGFVTVAMVVVMMVMAALAMIVGRLLRLERAVDRIRRAAGAADQFGGAGRNVENVRADFRGNVLAAKLPGEAQQTGRIAGADFQQRFLGGAHADEASILELQRIAVLQAHGAVQGKIDREPARRGQVRLRQTPGGVVEGHRIDDEIGPDGGLADDQAGFGHGDPRS